jgi:hypothetical protein
MVFSVQVPPMTYALQLKASLLNSWIIPNLLTLHQQHTYIEQDPPLERRDAETRRTQVAVIVVP